MGGGILNAAANARTAQNTRPTTMRKTNNPTRSIVSSFSRPPVARDSTDPTHRQSHPVTLASAGRRPLIAAVTPPQTARHHPIVRASVPTSPSGGWSSSTGQRDRHGGNREQRQHKPEPRRDIDPHRAPALAGPFNARQSILHVPDLVVEGFGVRLNQDRQLVDLFRRRGFTLRNGRG